MAELCAGAAVGAAFSELLKVLINVVKTTARFKSTFKRLGATLLAIAPIIEDIKRLDEVPDGPENEVDMFTDQLRKGRDLILSCSRNKSRYFWRKYSYSRKLEEYDDSLIRFFQIDMQAHQARDLKQIWNMLKDLNDKLCGSSTYPPSSSCIGDLPELILGLDLPLEEVKEMLLKDVDKGAMQAKNSSSLPVVVVLSAPPGCGKTTLAKMVCHDSEIKGTFKENIFFVTVSKRGNVKDIVQRVFQLKGCPDELQGVQSDEDAINRLGHLLRKIGRGPNEDPILLVLDDVWSPGLESLIDKFMFIGVPGYKILVTSRFYPPKFQTIYRLKLLDHQDATRLFRHYAFPPEHVSNALVNEIVKACNGFPLALKVVALSLCEKPEATWRIRLNKWSKGRSNIFDSNRELLNNLKTSLDALDDEKGMERLKDCFLDLGSFPEDQRIPATVLLDMWVELYDDLDEEGDDLDEEGMYTYDNINELSTRNLLNLVPIRKDDSSRLNGYCNGQFVTQHDMLRELAIHQCSQEPIELRKRLIIEIRGNHPPKELNQPLHARLVSISTDDSFTSNWYDMQLPEAEVLIMNLRTRNYTLPQFIKLMDKLKVLIVTNYGFCPAELNNFLVVGFLSSLKRIRLEHVLISSSLCTAFTFKLMNLKKISLTMCEIGNSFDNCANMFPNLVEIEIEYCRDLVKLPAGLCDNIHLQKIRITCCNELRALPEEIGKLINLRSLRLNSCTRLERLPETIGCLQQLNLLDVSDCLTLMAMPKRMGDLHGLRRLIMRGCSGLFELPQSVAELENLEVFCDKQTAALWKFYGNADVTLVKEDIHLNWLHN